MIRKAPDPIEAAVLAWRTDPVLSERMALHQAVQALADEIARPSPLRCEACWGEGVVRSAPVIDACRHCAARAEAQWIQQRQQRGTIVSP